MESGETPGVAEAQTRSEPVGARPERQSRDGRAPTILATHGLTKRFGHILAVDGLDMEVRRGDVFGFLGPNGAGKTTVIRLVLGLIHPTSGHVEVCGHRVPGELRGALRHVGAFVDDPTFYPLMSARRNLRLLGSMTGPVSEERIDEVLETVALSERADDRVGGFSHGMKQRLGIAQALLHSPELIVLDEPTSGLDPRGMKDVRELVRRLGATGTTVFLSSHLLHEVEQVCTRAVIINQGRLMVQGPVSDLRPRDDAVRVLTGDQVRAAVTSAWTMYQAAQESVGANRELVSAAQLALNGVIEERNVGQRTTLDVLNAEQELLDARAARITALADLQIANYSLLSAMGLLTAEYLNLGIPTYDPEGYYNAVKNAPATSVQGKSLDRVLQAIGKN